MSDLLQYTGFIYQHIKQFAILSEEEFNRLLPYFEIRSFRKKDMILHSGQVDDHLNLVLKGLVRKYVCVKNNERTLQLATEGHLVQSEISFHTRAPSEVMLQALEATTLVSMKYEDVQLALQQIPGAEQIGRKIVSYMFIKKDARSFSNLNHTTRQRFLNYLSQHPHMLQRVPQKILASYLNIKPETFSRLKHLLHKK